jgi:hypothetical protein
MKTLIVAIALLIGMSFSAVAAPAKKEILRHVVAFKFKEGTSAEDIKKVEDAFRNLKKTIPQIQSYEWGTNISPEKLDKGFTHGFILTFKTEKARDEYLVHPDHKKFGQLVGSLLADVFVIDFWAQD